MDVKVYTNIHKDIILISISRQLETEEARSVPLTSTSPSTLCTQVNRLISLRVNGESQHYVKTMLL